MSDFQKEKDALLKRLSNNIAFLEYKLHSMKMLWANLQDERTGNLVTPQDAKRWHHVIDWDVDE